MMKITDFIQFLALIDKLMETEQSFQKTPSIDIEIDFKKLNYQDDKLTNLCRALKTARISSISFANSQLSDKRAAAIIEALSVNPYVERLDLSYNQLGHKSAAALAAMVGSYTAKIESLNVSNNPLGEQVLTVLDGVKSYSRIQLVMKNTTAVPNTGVHSDAVATAIAEAARFFQQIDIGDNRFTSNGWSTINAMRGSALRGTQSCSIVDMSMPSASTGAASVSSTSTSSSATVPSAAASVSLTSTSSSATVPSAAPEPQKRTFYYAVTQEAMVFIKSLDSRPGRQEALKALKSGPTCYVYETEIAANRKKTSIDIQHSGYWGGKTHAVQYQIMTSAPVYNGKCIENHLMDTVIFNYHRFVTITGGTLLRSRLHEEELRNVVLAAYDAYALLHTPSTNTSSGADEGAGMCSTISSADRRETKASHTQAGVTRAMEFKGSLEGLEYVELIKALRDYAQGWFNGGFDKGQSFKAILYEKLIDKYGTEREKGFLASKTVIDQGDLLDALKAADECILAEVRGEVSAPRYRRR